jgi:S-adenosylmethionine decarboxylase
MIKSAGLHEHGVTFRVHRSRGHFGVHLTLDGYRGSPQRLGDPELVRWWLDDLPGTLGMNPLAEAVLVDVDKQSDKDPGGLTGFVLIAESHISIHTFPLRGFVSADVYTCKDWLDTNLLLEHFQAAFDLEIVEHNLIIRGTQYPLQNIYDDSGHRRTGVDQETG